jgi:hypothetical protein
MTPADLIQVFDRYKGRSGIVGVAFGPKEVSYDTTGNPLSVTFFVRKKLSVKGARRRLADGRIRLPKFVELQGSEIVTDVVTTDAERENPGRNRSPPQIFRAGGKISNGQLTGTFGCAVKADGLPGRYALTNWHISLDVGTVLAFPDFNTSDRIAGTTVKSTRFLADERFLPLFDHPTSFIDVDCGLVRIAAAVDHRVSADIPVFGAPAGIFKPTGINPAQYVSSLLNREVFSWSWQSGARRGTISHVYFVYQRTATGMQRVVCFTIKSSDGSPPGILGDSGKLWMTRDGDGKNLCIGVHSGVVADSPNGARFAMATEFASLARVWKLSLP